MQVFIAIIEILAYGLEAIGVVAILIGFAFATVRYVRHPQGPQSHAAYIEYRHGMGRALLLGLDFLIAGDIIKTVIITQTGTSVVVLGGIVLIRTFIAITLHVEVEGRWPWHEARDNGNDNGSATGDREGGTPDGDAEANREDRRDSGDDRH